MVLRIIGHPRPEHGRYRDIYRGPEHYRCRDIYRGPGSARFGDIEDQSMTDVGT